jgi:hypothetical protein
MVVFFLSGYWVGYRLLNFFRFQNGGYGHADPPERIQDAVAAYAINDEYDATVI